VLPRRLGPDRLRLRDVERFGQFAHLTYDVLPVAGEPARPCHLGTARQHPGGACAQVGEGPLLSPRC
jgi:hypothetical protein